MLLATAAFDRQTVLPGIRVSSAPSDGRQRSCSESPASLLGKRDVEGVVKRPYSNSRTASRFRGVTHHCRTSRFESHIWEEGKQVYLGGFYVEEQVTECYFSSQQRNLLPKIAGLASISYQGDVIKCFLNTKCC